MSWLEAILTAGCIALTVAAVLIPSEAAIPEGSFAPLAAAWCLLLVVWSASLWLVPRPRIVWGWTELGVALLVGWHTLAAVVHLGHGNDRQTLHALWLGVAYGIALFLWRQVLRSPVAVRATLILMLWLATTLAGWGLFQTAYSFPALRRQYAQNPTQLLAEQGLPTELGSPQRELFENRLQSTEPLAGFALTNSLAGWLAPWLIVAVWLGIELRQKPQWRPTWYATCLASSLIGGCLLLTKSRTAYLATGLGLLLVPLARRSFPSGSMSLTTPNPPVGGVFSTPRTPGSPEASGQTASRGAFFRWALILGAAVLLAVTGAALAGWLDWKVLAEAPVSVRYRLEYWQATLAMIREHPWWGSGPGNFQTVYAHYKLPQASEMVADPHNCVLEIAAVAGLPALMLLWTTLAAFFYDLWKLNRAPALIRTPEKAEVARPSRSRAARPNTPPAATGLSLFCGAFAGLIGAAPAALAVGLALESWAGVPVAWWIGIPFLMGAWYAGRSWWAQGSVSPFILILSLLVLGLHLQAAGAWVFPGVMMVGLVLVPGVLATEEIRLGRPDTVAGSEPVPHEDDLAPTSGGSNVSLKIVFKKILLSGGALFLAICSLATEYYPVLHSRVALDQARVLWQAGRLDEAERALLVASQADPRNPQPWEQLGELRLRRWLSDPSETHRAAFVEAAEQYVARDPQNHMAWSVRSRWYLTMWSNSRSEKDLELAIQACRAAVRYYPNRAVYHAQLAWVLYEAGQLEEARQEAELAWRLDQQMPHREQKLNRQKIFFGLTKQAGSIEGASDGGHESAEQTVERLRKVLVKSGVGGATEGAR